jgi:hypothetical protein
MSDADYSQKYKLTWYFILSKKKKCESSDSHFFITQFLFPGFHFNRQIRIIIIRVSAPSQLLSIRVKLSKHHPQYRNRLPQKLAHPDLC